MKLKTHRGAAKRFKLTGTGKIVRAKASKSHLLTVKNKKRKRRLRTSTLVHTAQAENMRRLLPYH